MTSQELPLAVELAIRARDHQGQLSLQQTLLIELLDQSQRKQLYVQLLGVDFKEYQQTSSLGVYFDLSAAEIIYRLSQQFHQHQRRPQFLVELALAGTGQVELLDTSLRAGELRDPDYFLLVASAVRNEQWVVLELLLAMAGHRDPQLTSLATMVDLAIREGRLERLQKLNTYSPVYNPNWYMSLRLESVPVERIDILKYLLDNYPDGPEKRQAMRRLLKEYRRWTKAGYKTRMADPAQIDYLQQQLQMSK